jgi:hypothetical protein
MIIVVHVVCDSAQSVFIMVAVSDGRHAQYLRLDCHAVAVCCPEGAHVRRVHSGTILSCCFARL